MDVSEVAYRAAVNAAAAAATALNAAIVAVDRANIQDFWIVTIYRKTGTRSVT